MRVLIVSYSFPPYNSIGAVRLGKMTKYLTEFGWDVRVLTAANQPFSSTLPLSIEADRVTYTRSFEVDGPARFANRKGGGDYVASGFEVRTSGLKNVLKTLYTNTMYLPDSNVGWLPFALKEGRKLVQSWKPDVIYASGPPFTSLMAAAGIARSTGIPWVAEFRDLWSSSPYYRWSNFRKRIDQFLERRTLSSASGFVGATAAIAHELAESHGKPTAKILSGFEPLDPEPETNAAQRRSTAAISANNGSNPGTLRIVYTGTIYRDKRDPKLLFEALLEMPPDSVEVDFYGRNLEPVREAIRDGRLGEAVKVYGAVSYPEAIARQAEADLLLLLLWMHPGDDGSIPAKVYEYLSAKRPILAIGLESCEASKLITSAGAGRVFQTREALLSALVEWSEMKRLWGFLPPVDAQRIEEFSSREQMRKLGDFLCEVAR